MRYTFKCEFNLFLDLTDVQKIKLADSFSDIIWDWLTANYYRFCYPDERSKWEHDLEILNWRVE